MIFWGYLVVNIGFEFRLLVFCLAFCRLKYSFCSVSFLGFFVRRVDLGF